jgi:hypothetical protein
MRGVTLKEDSRKGSRFLRVVERLIADVENKLRPVLKANLRLTGNSR